MRIASPPTMSSCFYGVDTPEKAKLLASRMTIEEMAEFIRVDFLGLPVDRRSLPGRAGAGAQQRCAAVLRRLLHRRLSDPPDRPRRRRQRPHAFAARQQRMRHSYMTDARRAGPPLVTGASRGIGYFIAMALRKGRSACDRRGANGRRARGTRRRDQGRRGLRRRWCRSTSPTWRRSTGSAAPIFERWGKLDILVANAGILGVISPIGHFEAKIFEKVMTVNVTATWRLIRSLDPLLTKSDAGRALLLSSGVAHSCRPFWGAYAASKAAVECVGRVWAGETQRLPLRSSTSIPALPARRCARRRCRARIRQSLPHPSEVAEKLLPLCRPGTDRHRPALRCAAGPLPGLQSAVLRPGALGTGGERPSFGRRNPFGVDLGSFLRPCGAATPAC